MIRAHVTLEGGEGGEVAAAVAGDVGGRLDARHPVQVGDGGGDGEAGVGVHGGREVAELVEVVERSWGVADEEKFVTDDEIALRR